jgi:hypothetical protein
LSIEESLRKHYAFGPLTYDPRTLKPLDDEAGQEAAMIVHEWFAEKIREGRFEVVGERDGKLVYRVM